MDLPHFVHGSTTFCSSLTFSFFHFLTVRNNTALTTVLQVSVSMYIFISLVCVYLKSRFTGLYGNSIFNFMKNCQTVFQSCCTILHSHEQCVRILMSSYSCQHLVLSVFFNYSFHGGNEPHCGFDLHFANN